MNRRPLARRPLSPRQLLAMMEYDALELGLIACAGGLYDGARPEDVRAFVLGSLEPALRQGLIRPLHLLWQGSEPPLDRLSVEEVLQVVVDGLARIDDPEREFPSDLWFIETPAGVSLQQSDAAAVPVRRSPEAAGADGTAPTNRRGQQPLRKPLAPLELLSVIGDDAIDLVDLAAFPGLFEGSPADEVRDFVIGSLEPALRQGLVRPARVRSLTRDGELHRLGVDEVLGLVAEVLDGLEIPGRSAEVDLWFFPTPAGVTMRRAQAADGPGGD